MNKYTIIVAWGMVGDQPLTYHSSAMAENGLSAVYRAELADPTLKKLLHDPSIEHLTISIMKHK